MAITYHVLDDSTNEQKQLAISFCKQNWFMQFSEVFANYILGL